MGTKVAAGKHDRAGNRMEAASAGLRRRIAGTEARHGRRRRGVDRARPRPSRPVPPAPHRRRLPGSARDSRLRRQLLEGGRPGRLRERRAHRPPGRRPARRPPGRHRRPRGRLAAGGRRLRPLHGLPAAHVGQRARRGATARRHRPGVLLAGLRAARRARGHAPGGGRARRLGADGGRRGARPCRGARHDPPHGVAAPAHADRGLRKRRGRARRTPAPVPGAGFRPDRLRRRRRARSARARAAAARQVSMPSPP